MALSSNPVLVLQIILFIQAVRYNAQIAENHAPDQTKHVSLLHKEKPPIHTSLLHKENCHPYTYHYYIKKTATNTQAYSTGNREIFLPELEYDVIRRDREKDHHGGILIAAKNELELSQVSISKEAEMVTGKIKIGTKQYTITSFYRPPNKTNNKYVERTITEIQNLRNNNKRSTFLLGGDFNLPDIDWEKNEIKGNQLPQIINRAFLQVSADLSIQQINSNTTRGNNILDLIFTSHPGLIERCKTLPPIGNSDHDIVLVDISANVNKPKPTKRKIYLWKKADLKSIGKHLDSQFDIFDKKKFDDINTMWTSINHIINESMENYVPTKRSLARQSHPWMNTHVRRMSRQKQRAYSKAKYNNSPKDGNGIKTSMLNFNVSLDEHIPNLCNI
ncbi:unnamed protein product [Mytilus coruscus]|uniref:Endonuclease/exonuclease/phosphatase domain-containing protein n=1 Tax=Mytilus coruscus TaxID=42192 RepID=A0A6J8AT89_MYTCO|nr:unnamed protein product [Mytilus coruscus]